MRTKFKYNKSNVCLNPEVIYNKTMKPYRILLGIAFDGKYWDYDYWFDCKLALTGAGGGYCGAWKNPYHKIKNRNEIILKGIEKIYRFINRHRKSGLNSPIFKDFEKWAEDYKIKLGLSTPFNELARFNIKTKIK